VGPTAPECLRAGPPVLECLRIKYRPSGNGTTALGKPRKGDHGAKAGDEVATWAQRIREQLATGMRLLFPQASTLAQEFGELDAAT